MDLWDHYLDWNTDPTEILMQAEGCEFPSRCPCFSSTTFHLFIS